MKRRRNRRHVELVITPVLRQKIRKLARSRGSSMSETVRRLVSGELAPEDLE